MLTVMVLVVLAGARNFREAGDQAADLPDVLLRAARARRDRRTGALVPPSGSTLRRVVENIDTDAADLLVCPWIAVRARRDGDGVADRWRGIAMDGKTIRRSGAGNPEVNVKLFSAMLHDQAVVIAQIRIQGEDCPECRARHIADGCRPARVSDEWWSVIEPLLPKRPAKCSMCRADANLYRR